MKTKFTKLLSLIIVLITLLSSSALPASAYKIGDVIGYALTTDIVATINGYDIPSYNVGGYTYIIVEDLRHYGFNVSYDDSTRMLSVSRNFSQAWVSKSYQKAYVLPAEVGKRAHSILFTDIKTYLDGIYTTSYNIDGQTIIRFDALSSYGTVSYDNNKREISLLLSDLNQNPTPIDRKSLMADAFAKLEGRSWRTVTEYGVFGDQELYIKKVEQDVVTFEFFNYRIVGFELTETINSDGTIDFHDKSYGIKGNIRFEGFDKIIFTVTESKFMYIKAGTVYEMYPCNESLIH